MVPERMFTIRFYIKCVAQIKLVLVKNVDFASKEAGFLAIHSGAGTAECGGGACAPVLLQMACHEWHSRANKKLTKLYSPSRKRSPKRLIVLVEPKKWKGHDKNIFPART